MVADDCDWYIFIGNEPDEYEKEYFPDNTAQKITCQCTGKHTITKKFKFKKLGEHCFKIERFRPATEEEIKDAMMLETI